jgi:GNAT superfamily N-acetyltransferase
MSESAPARATLASVRELEPSELDALIELYAHLHERDDPLPARAALERVWRELCSDPRSLCLGAFRGGELLASCTVAIALNLTRGARPYAVVENVVTHAEHRREGLGRAVLEEAIRRAWALDCYKVMLLSGANRADQHGFYKRVGFDRDAKQGFILRRP